jgi:hypothetical protein
VLGDDQYTYDNISTAPWFDGEDETTHRFLGVHALAIEGLPDSTREANTAESMLDGGVVGRVRRKTRRMRVRAVLTAQGEDALEAGFNWLSAALTPGSCGTHGDGCGSADAQFFVACPPERDDIVMPSVLWNDPVTNLVTNPSFEGVGGYPVPPANQATAAFTTDTPAGGTQALRFTLTTNAAAGLPVTNTLPETGVVHTLIGKVRPRTRNQSMAIRMRGTSGPTFTAPKDVWTDFRLTIAAGSGSVTQTGIILSSSAGHQINDVIDIDMVALVVGEYGGGYFDGSLPDSTESELETIGTHVEEYAWTGTVDGSTSTYRTGNVASIPDPVAYEQAVKKLVRTLHTVTCVSGPTVEQKLHRGDTWGYIVEFVLVAAVPWMFGITTPVDLQPSIPIVVQDVPFNLVPYPSAEIALGTVVASTNYATNPSVEADSTWWMQSQSGVVSGDVTGARSTDLYAEGTASFRSHFVASNSGGTGSVETRATVSFPTQTTGMRMSVNQWQAAILASGAATISKIEVYVEWLNGTTSLGSVLIGEVPPAGGSISAKSLAVPATANGAYVRARARLTSWTAGAVVDVYADALAVTVP